MYHKVLQLLLVFSLAFNIAFVGIWVYNRNRPAPVLPEPPPGPPDHADRAPWDALALKPEQKSKLAERWRHMSRETAELSAEVARQREQVLALMAAETADSKAIQECEERIEAGQTRLRRLTMAQMREMRDLLTPEQRQAWFNMMRSRADRGVRRRRALRSRIFEGGPDGRPRIPKEGPERPGRRPGQRSGPIGRNTSERPWS